MPANPVSPAVIGGSAIGRFRRPTAPRGFVRVNLRHAAFLRAVGLDTPAAILALPGEIVCGHPDRHVARAVIGTGPARWAVYLKREHVVGVRTRWRNWRAGFGRVSRSVREGDILRALAAAGLPGPDWLAYGEDGAGRAFLVVAELDAEDLRAILGDTALSPADRRRVATAAGRAVAGLHAAGFSTPELAAKHLFVRRPSLAVTLIDWQSAPRPGGVVGAAARARQLAALHASLGAEVASACDRLRFVRAYLRAGHDRSPRFAEFVRSVDAQARNLADRSSLRDQRQAAARRLVWLDGEAVCAVPDVAVVWPTPAIVAPYYADQRRSSATEPVRLADGRPATLTRFTTVDPVGRLVAAVRERPWRSPAATAARVLFHLDRYGIAAPKLFAFGQRARSAVAAESFVLTESFADAVPVLVWLARRAGPGPDRRAVVRECGDVLRRLHDAGCRVVAGERPVLVVRPGAAPAVAVSSPFAVRLTKQITDGDRRADLRTLLRNELAGLSRADVARLVRGYLGSEAARGAVRARLSGVLRTRSGRCL